MSGRRELDNNIKIFPLPLSLELPFSLLFSHLVTGYHSPRLNLSSPPHNIQLPNNSLLRVNEAINTIHQARFLAAISRRAGDFARHAFRPAEVCQAVYVGLEFRLLLFVFYECLEIFLVLVGEIGDGGVGG